jgi:hypothetical protein
MESSGKGKVAWQSASRFASILPADDPWAEGFSRDQLLMAGSLKWPEA